MALKSQDIEDALMPKSSKKPKQTDRKAHRKWQEEAEAGYEKLNDIGVQIVKEYFKSNPTGDASALGGHCHQKETHLDLHGKRCQKNS